MAKSNTSKVRDPRAVTRDTSELLAAWERYLEALRQFHGITQEQLERSRRFEELRVTKKRGKTP